MAWRLIASANCPSADALCSFPSRFRSEGRCWTSQEALDTSTPMGKAMFTIIGAMAELERNVIRERVVSGLEYARKHGTKSGNAIGRPKAVFDRAKVVQLRDDGRSWREI